MSNSYWKKLHTLYQKTDWINRPTIFANEAVRYFPPQSNVLELGAGQGQDSRFFASKGHSVTSTDIEPTALRLSNSKTPQSLKKYITFRQVDIAKKLPFASESFDVIYSHLALHYFNEKTTAKIFEEIRRVLKPGGVLAFIVNATNDPEIRRGKKIEGKFRLLNGIKKRYFSISDAEKLTKGYSKKVLNDYGRSHKDIPHKYNKGLIKFIGIKK